MGNKETKFYVVRIGKKIGIFDSREECKSNVNGFSGAKYKSFSSLNEANIALESGWESYYQVGDSKKAENNNKKAIYETIPFFANSIAVDAACAGNPGVMEYRGIDLQTGIEIFHEKFELGTNNIGEFLAIVHGLKYLKGDTDKKIYSDSRIAISRVAQGICKTQSTFDEKVGTAIKDAETWIQKYGINNDILKRDTENRGEIPADFGRK